MKEIIAEGTLREKEGIPLRNELAKIFEPRYFVSEYGLGTVSIQVKRATRFFLPWHMTRIWNQCNAAGSCVALVHLNSKHIEVYCPEVETDLRMFGERYDFKEFKKWY